MSKSSTATASKNPSAPLPTKSAWARGPPQTPTSTSPRSQSPAPPAHSQPHLTHSRRPSGLGQATTFKDGVSIPRSNAGSVKQGSAVSFGSIDDVGAPISSSPAAPPPISKTGTVGSTGSVKSFGSVPATQPTQVNGKVAPVPIKPSAPSSSSSTTSTPPPSTPTAPTKLKKIDVTKLFQNPSSAPSPTPSSEAASPLTRPSSLPGSQPSQTPPMSSTPSQPSQLGAHSYTPFVPQNNGMRQQPQTPSGPGGSGGSPVSNGPRSPGFSRQIPNGNGPRPANAPNGPGGPGQMNSSMPSPRLAPMAPHPGGQPGMPPQQQMPMWTPYYYVQDPNQPYMQYPGWYGVPQPVPHPPPPGPHGQPHMPVSPRNPPPSLPGQVPGTPTQPHAVPVNHTPQPIPPSHSSSNSISSLSSPPPTPSSSGRFNTAAPPFVPGSRPSAKITLKSSDGTELNLADLQKKAPSSGAPPTIPTPPLSSTPVGSASSSRRISAIPIVSPDDKFKRIAEEKRKEMMARDEEEKKKAKEAADKQAKEDQEKEEKEEAERKQKEAEEQERILQEKAETERLRKEEEEKERLRKEEEEKERARREEEERKKKEAEDAEKKRKEEADAAEQERVRKQKEEAEEKERLRKEEEFKAKEQEERSRKETKPAAAELEEGEVVEQAKPTGQPAPKDKKDGLRIDTAPTPPTSAEPRKRPGPLDLSTTLKPNIPAALPSALATARIISDIATVPYPEGIKSPKIELNADAKDGKFRYDRDFLLQFMAVCKEKPDNLPPLDAIGIEPAVQQGGFGLSRGGSGHGGPRSRTGSGAQAPSRQPSSSGFPGGSGFAKSGAPNPFGSSMGNFGTPVSKLTSEERFARESQRSVSGSALGGQFGRPAPMQRTSSVGGGVPLQNNRTRSKRGEKRNDSNKVGQGHGSQFGNNYNNANQPGLEPVVPLQASANRWERKLGAPDTDSPEVVDRKVKGLLNKLTMEKFDSISDQIIDWANKSEKEKDGRTLIQVIRLVFEKATDEATWSEMYARLCRKMMETISPRVQDDGIKNAEGKPITGGQLFRKYLLNRCQEDFERGWVAKEATAAAAASKALEDQAAAASNEKDGNEEAALYSEEYYAAQKAKRQGLGLIKFIGELFKLQMLTERIMHECVKKLLGNVENPEEEEIESLCKLLTTVGAILDTNKARAHMDVYFSRMKELTKSANVNSRMQFMLQDLIELRERKWVARNAVAAPTTIAQIHEAAAKEKAIAEKESYQRMSMSRTGSKRGGDRSDYQQVGPDGWAVAGGNTQPRPPPKAGDLSKFGKISVSGGAPSTFGPSSVFSKGKDGKKDPTLSRVSSNSNMFSALQGDAPQEPTKSRPPSRKASVDFGQAGAPEAPQRRRLILQPRSIPVETGPGPAQTEDGDDASNSSEDEDAAPTMSAADAKKKIGEDLKEFFAVRNLEEAESYFTNLPPVHHILLVDTLVSRALESKEVDAKLVHDFFAVASEKDLCSIQAFEAGFSSAAANLDDIAIDAPKAPSFMALMMKGPGFDSEHRSRIAANSEEQGHHLSS